MSPEFFPEFFRPPSLKYRSRHRPPGAEVVALHKGRGMGPRTGSFPPRGAEYRASHDHSGRSSESTHCRKLAPFGGEPVL
jgi:hypothetical protein